MTKDSPRVHSTLVALIYQRFCLSGQANEHADKEGCEVVLERRTTTNT